MHIAGKQLCAGDEELNTADLEELGDVRREIDLDNAAARRAEKTTIPLLRMVCLVRFTLICFEKKKKKAQISLCHC